MAKFGFDKDFQLEVLSLIFQKWDFLVAASELVKPEYFEDKVFSWFLQKIFDYYIKYNQKPTATVIKNEMIKACKNKTIKPEEVSAYTEVYGVLDRKVVAEDYIREEVIRFCKAQALKKALLDVSQMIHSEDLDIYDQIGEKLALALSVGDHAADLGLRYFEEVDERVRLRSLGTDKMTIPTGIPQLDTLISGGLEEEAMMIWMGGTGAGKSLALAQCGRRAVIGGYKVVYYTLELSDYKVAARYDSLISKVPMMELDLHPSNVVGKVTSWGNRYGNNLVIKQYPAGQASVNTIKAHLTMLRNNGFDPDLVIVDYLDLLKPLVHYTDEYSSLGAIATDLRGLSTEFKVALQTATQINRAGMASEIVGLEHVSDSLKKLFVADIVAAICMNNEEKASNRARVFLAKNREGPANREVAISTAYDRMAFYASRGEGQPIDAEADESVLVRRRNPRDLQEGDFPLGNSGEE